MNRDWIPQHADGIALFQSDGVVVLTHDTLGWSMVLNESAYLIWRLCDGSRTCAEIEVLLRDAFPGKEATVVADTRIALAELETAGVLIRR